MRSQISDEILLKLIDASTGTVFRSCVEQAVSIFFHSVQYKTSKLLADCITLNLLLNDEIAETSADEIVRCVKRANKSFYTSVESAFKSIEDKFIAHAKTVINDYGGLMKKNLRTVNLLVYVISLYVAKNYRLNRDEIFTRAYSYDELYKTDVPHYGK